MRRGRSFLILANLVVLTIASLLMLLRPAPVALALNLDVGETARYQLVAGSRVTLIDQVPGAPAEIVTRLDQTFTWKVVAVDDEAATVELTIEQARLTVNGDEMPLEGIAGPRQIMVRRDGVVLTPGSSVELGPLETSSGAFPMIDQMTPLLPSRAVRPGDTWEISTEVPLPSQGSFELTAENRLVSIRDVDGVRVAEIASSLETPFEITQRFSDLFPAESPKPGALDVTIRTTGQGAFDSVSVLEVESGRLVSTSSEGSYELAISIEGLPKETPQTSRYEGTFTLELRRLD